MKDVTQQGQILCYDPTVIDLEISKDHEFLEIMPGFLGPCQGRDTKRTTYLVILWSFCFPSQSRPRRPKSHNSPQPPKTAAKCSQMSASVQALTSNCVDSYVNKNHRNLRTKTPIMSSNLCSWQGRIYSLKHTLYGFIESNFKCQSYEAPIAFFEKDDLFIIWINFTISSYSKHAQDAVLNKNMECPQ